MDGAAPGPSALLGSGETGGSGDLSGQVRIEGSSTVYPLTALHQWQELQLGSNFELVLVAKKDAAHEPQLSKIG